MFKSVSWRPILKRCVGHDCLVDSRIILHVFWHITASIIIAIQKGKIQFIICLFVCPSFAAQREEMLQSISNTLPDITIHIPALKDKISLSQKLLFGTGSFEIDVKLLNIVEVYITSTQPFF